MHDWLNRTFEQLPEGLGVCRLLREEGRAVDYVREELNEAYARCLGLRRDELRGRKASETNSLVPELLELFDRADETGKPLSVECRCEARTLLVSVLPLEPRIASVCLRDITERKAAEEALRQSEERYRLLFEQAQDGIFMIDETGHYVDANPSGCQMLGYTLEELCTMTAAEVLPKEDLPIFLERRTAFEEGRPTVQEWRLQHKDGHLVPVESTIKPFGKGWGQAIVRDITERKRAETEKERLLKEKMEALEQLDRCKDEFLSVLSHELRTPLNAITGFGSLLADRVTGELSEKQGFFVEQILRGADRMITLVDDLLDVARIRTGRFQIQPMPGSFRTVLEETVSAVQPLAKRKQILIRLDSEDQVLPFDPIRIRQVLQNLLINAIHFSHPGKSIRLRTALSDSFLLTECRDEGIGISPEKLPKLFSPFHQIDMSNTRRVGGTGLGLCICKAIVEAHGGTIEVESDGLGCGATFRFRLPLGSKPDSVAS
ncbi:MAG: PAS domain S-box protein [Bacteroidota bacterium]